MKIAINGVGIAGPALAFWLRTGGHDVLLVEQAATIRTDGYVIDFWGVGFDIAERMGLIPQMLELGYQIREVRFVDRQGKKSGGFETSTFGQATGGRFTSLRRSDVSATIYGALDAGVETIFGDSISEISDLGDHLRIHFDNAAPREVDLVVGADGLHSRIRELTFGAESRFSKDLGYHVAAFEADGYRPRDELVYVSHSIPGRQISRFSMRDDKTLFLFVFRNEYLNGKAPTDVDGHKTALSSVFADMEWEAPRILEAMEQSSEIYFDRVSQIRMGAWFKGRTALIGDAAASVSLLAGEGTGLAIAEAYVLAGEINNCGGDYSKAFARYQQLMKPFLQEKQEAAAKFASSFAPQTSAGIYFRNLVTRLFRIPFVAKLFVGRSLKDNIALPDYDGRAVGPSRKKA